MRAWLAAAVVVLGLAPRAWAEGDQAGRSARGGAGQGAGATGAPSSSPGDTGGRPDTGEQGSGRGGDGTLPGSGFLARDELVLEIDDCPPMAAVDADTQRRRGSEHFQRGEVLYVQGDYRGAVKELVAAYCIAPFHVILKDIGQAYERELDYERAVAYFERYVAKVPADARPASACDGDPQDDKRNVIARIKTLQQLPAKVRVRTEPVDARITLESETGQVSAGVSDQEIEVPSGRYEVLVERDGYVSERQRLSVKIGKPYTLLAKLERRRGILRVRTVPANARLFLDARDVGVGAYSGELDIGAHRLTAEADDRVKRDLSVEVLAGRDTSVTLELSRPRQTGRGRFLAYATLAGAFAGYTLATPTGEDAAVLGLLVGLAGGGFGSFLLAPRDLALGTSSLSITSSLVGGVGLGFAASLGSESGSTIFAWSGAGLLLGGGAGYYFGARHEVSPGDAAVVNSGAVWGTSLGVAFALGFSAEGTIKSGLALSGLGAGTLGGVVLARSFEVSRAHVALIDVGGVVGGLIGVAAESVVKQSQNDKSENVSAAIYAAGGMVAGIIGVGLLTRNLDAPALSVTPSVSQTRSGGQTTTSFGLGGTF